MDQRSIAPAGQADFALAHAESVRKMMPWVALGALSLGVLAATAVVREVRHQRRRRER